MEQALAVSIRQSTWLPIDWVLEILLKEKSNISISSVYQLFVRNDINIVPKQEREKAKKFKEYEHGYLHIDVTYLPMFGEKNTIYL